MPDSSNIWNFLLICSDKFAYNEWVSSSLGQPFQPRWPLALRNSMDSCWVFHSIRIYCHIQISISLKNRQTLTNADVKSVQCLLTRVKAQLTNQPWGYSQDPSWHSGQFILDPLLWNISKMTTAKRWKWRFEIIKQLGDCKFDLFSPYLQVMGLWLLGFSGQYYWSFLS